MELLIYKAKRYIQKKLKIVDLNAQTTFPEISFSN